MDILLIYCILVIVSETSVICKQFNWRNLIIFWKKEHLREVKFGSPISISVSITISIFRGMTNLKEKESNSSTVFCDKGLRYSKRFVSINFEEGGKTSNKKEETDK